MSNWFEGTKVIKRVVRPPRVAFIVETLEQCESLIEILSLTWGGKSFCLVPYQKNKGLSEEWLRVLETYDPDRLVSCTTLDTDTKRRLLSLTAFRTPEGTEDNFERICDYIDPINQTPIYGQSMYLALASVESQEKRERFPPALIPVIPNDHPLRIYIMAKYGYLNENKARRWSIVLNEGFKSEITMEYFLQLEHIELGDNFFDFIVGTRSVAKKRRSLKSPLDYTLLRLTQKGPERNTIKELNDHSIVYDAQLLLLVSDGISVEDFCWFWTLRSQRYLPNQLLPLWLPKELVEERKSDLQFNGGKKGALSRVFLLSKTLSISELQRIATELGHGIEVETNNLDRFFATKSFVGIEDEQEVIFNKGRVRITIPQADVVNYCKHPRYFYVDIDLSEYALPRININSWGQEVIPAFYRVSKTGLSFCCQNLHRDIQFAVPTPWQILESLTSLANYDVELSDKGKKAKNLIDLLGGEDKIWIFSGQSVYRLFNELSEISQSKELKTRVRSIWEEVNESLDKVPNYYDFESRVLKAISSDLHERFTKQSDQIKDILEFNQKTAEKFIEWLLRQRLIFRGTEVRCRICDTKQWLNIDDIKSTMKCKGCLRTLDSPLNVTSTIWKYQVNSLYAKAHEQGILPHLMTVNYYQDLAWENHMPWDINTIIGSWYGIIFKPREKMGKPVEVDVAWIYAGDLYIGECKTNSIDLTPVEVSKFIALAMSLNCKRLIFSVLDDLKDLDSKVLELIKNSSIAIDILDANKLFNQYPNKNFIESKLEKDCEHKNEFKKSVTAFLEREGF